MSEEIVNPEGSAKLPDMEAAGIPQVQTPTGPAAAGEPKENADETKAIEELQGLKVQYEEAEKKLGEQGRELGEHRTFVKELTPLLDKLQAQPEIVEAIMEDLIDSTLIQAVADGKVTIGDAVAVTEAHKEIKQDMGKEYEQASAEDIEKMINDKVEAKLDEHTQNFESGLKNIETKREFEDQTNDFVKATSDFVEYAEAIGQWFDDHPDQYDVEIAYHAVKGRMSVAAAQKEATVRAGEAAKNTAANAAGGASQGGTLPDGTKLIDTLIAPKANPNSF